MRESSSTYASRIRRFRLPRICMAVVGADAPMMIERAESLVRDNPFLELSLDYLSQPLAALPKLKTFVEMHPEATFIATCRRAVNGGKFKGTVGCGIGGSAQSRRFRFPLSGLGVPERRIFEGRRPEANFTTASGMILSYHNFKNTKKLDEQFAEMSQYPADFYKVVSTATNLYDNVVMMKFLEANSGQHEMVGLCMGEQGIISRVLGVRAGSIFTFGAATRGRGDRSRPGLGR